MRSDAADEHHALDDAGTGVFAGAIARVIFSIISSSSIITHYLYYVADPARILHFYGRDDAANNNSANRCSRCDQAPNYNQKTLILVPSIAVNFVNLIIDRICYGYWVVPAWNFVRCAGAQHALIYFHAFMPCIPLFATSKPQTSKLTFRFNVFQNGSAFYGTNPIYW